MFFSKKWITLVEVLIAIIVFGVGLITILAMISKNISVVDRLELRTKSTFLAKQWIEIVYNKRDSNLQRWVKWNCVDMDSSYNCNKFFKKWDSYKVFLNLTWYYSIKSTDKLFESNLLYKHFWMIKKESSGEPILTGFRYDHNWTERERTFFSRYIDFTWAYLEWDGGIADEEELLKLESVVSYDKAWMTGNIVLESFIWDR